MTPQKSKELVIVGIGASAGGLEALQELLASLPDDVGMAYVISQHLSPTYKSMMVELLSKCTPKSVLEAKDRILIEGNTIYITPPNKNIMIDGETIILQTPSSETFIPKPSVDIFFESLAISKKNRAIGIILSGTGSDGSRGMQAIKAEGGITMAQEPNSAKYNGMPLAAISAQSVDMVLTPTQMGQELPDIAEHIRNDSGDSILRPTSSDMESILMRINQVKNVDFSEYKPTTIGRRVYRRMAALKISDTKEYVNYLYKSDEEPNLLFKDILIGVTEFFRDDDAFEELKVYLGDIVAKKGHGGILRVWDVGCSSGEETYSVAMTILEVLESKKLQNKINVQIFATDIDENATRIAREGCYPASALLKVPRDKIARYFRPENEHFRVTKELRDMVIFSQHDLIKDPPFLRLDMIVCRNLLIYFGQRLQDRVFPFFHYALNNGGLLFLGKSESIGRFGNLFTPISKNRKIYRREFSITKEIPMRPITKRNNYVDNHLKDDRPKEKSLEQTILERIGSYFMPMSIVVNDGMDIIYIREENPYIKLAAGTVTTNVFKCIHEDLAAELRTLIHECDKESTPKSGAHQYIRRIDGDELLVRLTVIPLIYGKNSNKLYIVNFQEERKAIYIDMDELEDRQDRDDIKRLESELKRTKAHLQAVIEELETTNEELQALNEELQSSNEELQSSNEELETTNEELQSTNEELQTAYAELKAVSDEREEQRNLAERRLDESNAIKTLLQEVLDSSLSGISALDAIRNSEGKIVDFTFSLINKKGNELLNKDGVGLFGKHLLSELPSFRDIGLFDMFVLVAEEGQDFYVERLYRGDGLERWFSINCVKHNDGVVATFIDITETKRAEQERMLFEKSRRMTVLELLENLSH